MHDSVNDGLLSALRYLHSITRYTAPDITHIAAAVLLALNIPANSTGFAYLRLALSLFCEDPNAALFSGIYARMISFDPSLTTEQIEQAIRRCIRKAWKNRNSTVWKRFFSTPDNGILEMPTSQEFISRIGYILFLFIRRK